MLITTQHLEYFYTLGLNAIPLVWEGKDVSRFPLHRTESTGPNNTPTIEDAKRWLTKEPYSNGVGVKLYPPWGMLDFDLKNTENKTIFEQFMTALDMVDDSILAKIAAEKTRSGGYHVYFKYIGLSRKLWLARRTDGREVVSLYTAGLISYVEPTPGYQFVHGDLSEISALTEGQFDTVCDIIRSFDEYKDPNVETTQVKIEYPVHYRQALNEYDQMTDKKFNELLLSIGLVKATVFNSKASYVPYLRKGSNAKYSAKAYFGRVKKLLIFSGSMAPLPCWADRKGENDHDWVLTPSKIHYYLLDKSWDAVAAELDIKPKENTKPDRQHEPSVDLFPIEIYPAGAQASFRQLSKDLSIPLDFICTAALFSVTSLSGNMYRADSDKHIRNIMYCLLVGGSGVGKTPAYNVTCGDIIAPYEAEQHERYEIEVAKYKEERAHILSAKGNAADLLQPAPFMTRMIKGGTMEGIMKHAKYARAGFGIYYDEGGRMMTSPGAYRKDNNSLDFWNELWNGNSFFDVRADQDRERYIKPTSISVMAGMQTSRLDRYFTVEEIESGLAGRFLICHSERVPLREDVNYFDGAKYRADEDWREIIITLFKRGLAYNGEPARIQITEGAREAMSGLINDRRRQSNKNNTEAKRDGITAVMQSYDTKLYEYQQRFLIPLSLIANLSAPVIDEAVVEKARKLYDYFRIQAIRVFTRLLETQQTGLSQGQQDLYRALPDDFTDKEASIICEQVGLSKNFFSGSFRTVYEKWGWVKKISRGKYQKTN